MALEHSNGTTVVVTQATIPRTKSTATESSNGRTDARTKENGRTADSMEKGNTHRSTDRSNLANGKMASERGGSIDDNQTDP